MFRFSRSYQKSEEFASRQGWLFSGLDRICIEAAVDVASHIKAVAAKALKALGFGQQKTTRKGWFQMVLEENSIHQLALAGLSQ